jgi:UTP--glucose-1-phosphate uridylyltransferase
MIRKVVVPAAGLGTRLFPTTKEQPKEMLPVFSKLDENELCLKPILQIVFEQLYDAGFQNFCFVVGKGKRSIEDHFTPDHDSISILKNKGMNNQALSMHKFYEKLNNSTIFWVNQPEPKGFGYAVSLSRSFVQDEPFLVHAGDTYIVSEKAGHISSLVKLHERLGGDATILVQEVENPKQYGVIEGVEVEKTVYKVAKVVEKPEKPATNLAIVAIYVFHPVIFKALEKTKPGKGGEIQLTDAIQTLINWGLNVYALKLSRDTPRLDIGSPETYWEALSMSYQRSAPKFGELKGTK